MPDKSQPFVFIARIIELSLLRAGSFDLLWSGVDHGECSRQCHKPLEVSQPPCGGTERPWTSSEWSSRWIHQDHLCHSLSASVGGRARERRFSCFFGRDSDSELSFIFDMLWLCLKGTPRILHIAINHTFWLSHFSCSRSTSATCKYLRSSRIFFDVWSCTTVAPNPDKSICMSIIWIWSMI